jgi:hypothetical protein
VFNIADLPDRRVSILVNPSDFARGHPDECISCFAVA